MNVEENLEEDKKLNEIWWRKLKNMKKIQKEKILDFINLKKVLLCDDCLSKELEIYPRQAINSGVRKLEKEKKIKREKILCDKCYKKKIIAYK